MRSAASTSPKRACAVLLMFTRRVVACVAPTINSNSVDKAVLGGGSTVGSDTVVLYPVVLYQYQPPLPFPLLQDRPHRQWIGFGLEIATRTGPVAALPNPRATKWDWGAVAIAAHNFKIAMTIEWVLIATRKQL